MAPKPNPEIVRYLLESGANPLRKNLHGSSPKDIAEKKGLTNLFQ